MVSGKPLPSPQSSAGKHSVAQGYAGCSTYLSGVKNAVMLPLRGPVLKKSTAGDSALPFSVSSLR